MKDVITTRYYNDGKNTKTLSEDGVSVTESRRLLFNRKNRRASLASGCTGSKKDSILTPSMTYLDIINSSSRQEQQIWKPKQLQQQRRQDGEKNDVLKNNYDLPLSLWVHDRVKDTQSEDDKKRAKEIFLMKEKIFDTDKKIREEKLHKVSLEERIHTLQVEIGLLRDLHNKKHDIEDQIIDYDEQNHSLKKKIEKRKYEKEISKYTNVRKINSLMGQLRQSKLRQQQLRINMNIQNRCSNKFVQSITHKDRAKEGKKIATNIDDNEAYKRLLNRKIQSMKNEIRIVKAQPTNTYSLQHCLLPTLDDCVTRMNKIIENKKQVLLERFTAYNTKRNETLYKQKVLLVKDIQISELQDKLSKNSNKLSYLKHKKLQQKQSDSSYTLSESQVQIVTKQTKKIVYNDLPKLHQTNILYDMQISILEKLIRTYTDKQAEVVQKINRIQGHSYSYGMNT